MCEEKGLLITQVDLLPFAFMGIVLPESISHSFAEFNKNNSNGWLLNSANVPVKEAHCACIHHSCNFTHIHTHNLFTKQNGPPRIVERPVEKRVLSWVLNSERVGRFCKLAGCEFQTDGTMKQKECSPYSFIFECVRSSKLMNMGWFFLSFASCSNLPFKSARCGKENVPVILLQCSMFWYN